MERMSKGTYARPFRWRDYEADRREWERRHLAEERRSTRFWYGWTALALIAALTLIWGCSGPAPTARGWGDMACEARDTVGTVER